MSYSVPRPELESFIREHYRDWSIDDIADRFKVTRAIVYWRMIRLELDKKPDRYDGRRISAKERAQRPVRCKPKAEKVDFFNVDDRENWLL